MTKEMMIYLVETRLRGLRTYVFINESGIAKKVRSYIGRIRLTDYTADVINAVRVTSGVYAEPEMRIKVFGNTSKLRKVLSENKDKLFSVPVVMQKEGPLNQTVFVVKMTSSNKHKLTGAG